MKRNNAKPEYKWDFSHLYKNHAEWEKDVDAVVEIFKKIADLKGNLHKEEIFIKYCLLNKEAEEKLEKIAVYTRMSDIDTTNLEYQKLFSIYTNKINDVLTSLSFTQSELKEVGKDKIMSFIKNNKEISHLEYPYRSFFKRTKHVLSEKAELLISKLSRTLSANDSLYDTLAYADNKKVMIEIDGKEEELTITLYKKIMENSDPIKDQELRKKAASLFSKQYTSHKHTFAEIYKNIIVSALEDQKLRGYNDIVNYFLESDEVSNDILESLIDAGQKNSDLFVKFNEIVKKHFKFKKFYSTDRSLKLTQNIKGFLGKKFEIEDAKKIIKEALKPLGNEYLSYLDIAWQKNRIDYFEDTNKRSGAYSTGGGTVDPIILMNWDYTIQSVNTLAHEVGHSVHTMYADKYNKGPLANYPIILAEVASTVNEHLMFDYLIKKVETKEEKIYLIQNRIEDIMATFFRQIHFAKFEYQAFKKIENKEHIDSDILGNLFKDIANDFGYSVFDDDKKKPTYGWPRISHFFHSPFYVYKYATCIVASFKLYEDVQNNKPETLIEFLKQGGRKEPLEILKSIGIDYTDKKVYEPLLNELKTLIKDLEKLLGA